MPKKKTRKRRCLKIRKIPDVARVVPLPHFQGPKKCALFRHPKNAFSSGDFMSFCAHFLGPQKIYKSRFFRWHKVFLVAVKMRLIGGKWGVKMAPENGGLGTTLATSKEQEVRISPPGS